MLTSLLQLNINLTEQATEQGAPYAGGFEEFISRLLTGLMAVGAFSVFIFLIWGAFDWLNSSGEKGKIEAARNKMTGALMGLAVLAMILVIFSFLQDVLGIRLLQFVPTGPSGAGASESVPDAPTQINPFRFF